MKIKLSKLLIVFYILSNHFSFAQTDILLDNILTRVEDIKNGSANDVNGMCDPNNGLPNGPWYQAYWITDSGRIMNEWYMLGNPNEGDPISSQRRGNLSLIDKDGVVVFCEGESRFSGLVTAENVAFIGNGEPENIIVSPAENFYFNLISLDIDNLQLFANHYNLDDVEKIDRNDNDARILIDNVTFTNHNSERKISPWRGQSDYQLEECLPRRDDSPKVYIRLDDYDPRPCLDRNDVLNISSGAAIQVDRPRTFLHINNVIFKEFANIARIIESNQKGGDTEIQNTQIIDNQTIEGTIRAYITENLSLSNIDIINNYRADLELAIRQDHSKNLSLSNIKILNNFDLDFFLTGLNRSDRGSSVNIEIENIEVANNDSVHFLSISKEFTGENILFRNNAFKGPIQIYTPENSYFNINNFNLINNRGDFWLLFFGSGRITESIIEKNTFTLPNVFVSEALTIDNLVFNKNTKHRFSSNPFFVNIGNIDFNNTVFTDNEIPTDASLYSIIEPRGLIAATFHTLGTVWFPNNNVPYESLAQHRLQFNNVKYINRNRDVNIPLILAYNSSEGYSGRFREIERQMGRQITLENYQELLRLPVNDAVSIYQFNAIDNLQCGYENDIYECSR